MKPVAKKKKFVSGHEAYELFKEQTVTRYRIASAALEAQDQETQTVIWAIVDRLRLAASGVVRVFPHGKRGESIVIPVEQVYQDYNLLFVATEILKDLALMDVQVANYKFPTVFCAECGERL